MNEPNSVIIQTKKGKKLKRQIPITLRELEDRLHKTKGRP